jgi:hypothetical protein
MEEVISPGLKGPGITSGAVRGGMDAKTDNFVYRPMGGFAVRADV